MFADAESAHVCQTISINKVPSRVDQVSMPCWRKTIPNQCRNFRNLCVSAPNIVPLSASVCPVPWRIPGPKSGCAALVSQWQNRLLRPSRVLGIGGGKCTINLFLCAGKLGQVYLHRICHRTNNRQHNNYFSNVNRFRPSFATEGVAKTLQKQSDVFLCDLIIEAVRKSTNAETINPNVEGGSPNNLLNTFFAPRANTGKSEAATHSKLMHPSEIFTLLPPSGCTPSGQIASACHLLTSRSTASRRSSDNDRADIRCKSKPNTHVIEARAPWPDCTSHATPMSSHVSRQPGPYL